RQRHLIRIRQVNLGSVRNRRRTQGQFPAANNGFLNRQRKENIRLADVIVIEEVVSDSLKVVGIDRPSAIRNRYPELMLLITFTVQGNESQIIHVDESQQRSSSRQQWRRLVVLSIDCSEAPPPLRYHDRCAKSRADCVF